MMSFFIAELRKSMYDFMMKAESLVCSINSTSDQIVASVQMKTVSKRSS